jgi:hypothetical protein
MIEDLFTVKYALNGFNRDIAEVSHLEKGIERMKNRIGILSQSKESNDL